MSAPATPTGRTALVTGSTDGIGAAIAHALAAAGAHVVVTGRSRERGEKVVAAIAEGGGRADFVPADLARPADVRELAAAAHALTGGPLDVLVNNAARLVAPGPTAQVGAELIDEAFAVSVRAPFLLTGLVAAEMAGRGRGAVINIGSINGLVGMAGSALYSATKATIHSLTRSWAAEYGPHGVRVNTVAPGPTETARNAAIREHLAPIVARAPSGRLSGTDEVAAAVVFLAGDAASGINGATLTVDGGWSAV
jgi:NAD(P)-dependent dehydrogenase (short-subunit alcohol dehydrogenase family)